MDPDATLAELRELIDTGDFETCPSRLVELFQGLDEWLFKGGFLPTDWSARRR